MSDATKHDTGKKLYHLLPWDAVEEIVGVLMFGAEKYEKHNWAKGMDWSRPHDAAMRHLTAWWRRDGTDKESGLSHLAHAGACILFLIAYELRNIGRDDRP